MCHENKKDDASGLTNLARNIWGSAGTAFVATMLSRGSQRHEASMIRSFTPATQNFNDRIGQLQDFFGGSLRRQQYDRPGTHAAERYIYNQRHRQSSMLAYMDIIAIFCVFCACMIRWSSPPVRSSPATTLPHISIG